MFTRLLHLKDFSMTSGLGFIFDPNHKDYILTRSRKMQKKIKSGDASVDRFVVYFHLNRSDGMPILYKDIEVRS